MRGNMALRGGNGLGPPGGGRGWWHIKLLHLVLLLMLMLVTIPLLTHHYLSTLGEASSPEAGHKTRRQLDHSFDELAGVKIAEQKFRIEVRNICQLGIVLVYTVILKY